MNIRYDKEADALYIGFSKEKIEETREREGNVLVDLDRNGGVVGIEILHYSKVTPPESRFLLSLEGETASLLKTQGFLGKA